MKKKKVKLFYFSNIIGRFTSVFRYLGIWIFFQKKINLNYLINIFSYFTSYLANILKSYANFLYIKAIEL